MHFTHVKHDAPGIVVGRAHLLQDIIDNIENFDSHYYAKKTLRYIISDKNLLFSYLKTAGIVGEITGKDNDVINE